MVGHPYKGSGRRDSGRLNRALHHPTELPLEASFSGLKLITTGVVSILYLSTNGVAHEPHIDPLVELSCSGLSTARCGADYDRVSVIKVTQETAEEIYMNHGPLPHTSAEHREAERQVEHGYIG